MVWADERPIDRPHIRHSWPGEVPGWRLKVNYDSGTRTETWQTWRQAAYRALVAAGPPEDRLIRHTERVDEACKRP